MPTIDILIADDHAEFRRNLRSVLESQSGWRVCGEAADGEEAVVKANQLRPQVVLMDLSMPRMDGIQATRIIRQQVPECEVIILSQNDPALASQQVAELGAAGSVQKSRIANDLFVTIERVVKHNPSARSSAAEKQLERQEIETYDGPFRKLAESIPQLVWMAEPDGYIFWYNQRWYEYTGTTPEQILGWGWQSVHDPQVLPKVLELWKRSIATGEPFEMIFPLRGGDGEFRDFLTRCHPLKDERGKVVRWFGTNTEVTAQRKAEEAVRESERRFREMIDVLPAVIYTTDAEGWLTHFNPAAVEFAGRVPEIGVDRWCVTLEAVLAGWHATSA